MACTSFLILAIGWVGTIAALVYAGLPTTTESVVGTIAFFARATAVYPLGGIVVWFVRKKDQSLWLAFVGSLCMTAVGIAVAWRTLSASLRLNDAQALGVSAFQILVFILFGVSALGFSLFESQKSGGRCQSSGSSQTPGPDSK
jgi:hypothetical protein